MTKTPDLSAMGIPLVLEDISRGQTIAFAPEVAQVTVGRGKDCRLTFPDAPWRQYLAREHALFLRQGDQWFLLDRHSMNKTYVNGTSLVPNEPVLLQPGDEIRFAGQAPLRYIEKKGEENHGI